MKISQKFHTLEEDLILGKKTKGRGRWKASLKVIPTPPSNNIGTCFARGKRKCKEQGSGKGVTMDN